MKARIEKAMSKVLSNKYDAKVTIKFVKEGQDNDENKTRAICEK